MHSRPSRTGSKLVLGVGFAALLVAVLSAYSEPAIAYEISIYRATPTTFWLGLGIALAVSLLLLFYGPVDRWVYGGAFLLAFLAFFSFVALPEIRGYFFLGAGDSLTHLGWVKDLSNGLLDPLTFLYPAGHLTAFWAITFLGLAATDAVQLVVLVYFGLFLLLVPLCVRAVCRSGRALGVGLFAAGLLLPINNVSTFRLFHTFSLSILFLPLVLYLLFAHVLGRNSRSATGTGLLLVIASLALLLIHPQLGVGLVLALVLLTAFQFLTRWRSPNHPLATHRSLAAPTLVVGSFYVFWVGNKPGVQSLLSAVVTSLRTGILYGDEVSQQGSSAEAIGMSFEVMAAKLFLVSAVFVVLAGLVVFALVTRRLDGRDRDALLPYLVVVSFPLFGLFVLLFVASVGDFYFRYLGAVMVVVTILGAIGLTKGFAWVDRYAPAIPARTVIVCLFVVLVPLSLMSVYFSPYILRGSSHVTEQRLQGYDTAFDHDGESVDYVGIRRGVHREAHGLYGEKATADTRMVRDSEGVEPAVFETNLSTHYDGPRYLALSTALYDVELGMYGGYRYSERGFQGLETTPGIDRVSANGGFELYLLRNGSTRESPT